MSVMPPQELVLITGGTGFVGAAIVEALRGARTRVRVLARTPSRVEARDGVEVVQGDLAHPESLEPALRGVTSVYHVGGQVGHHGERDTYFRVNVDGTSALLHAAHRAGVRRFVHTSTPSVIADGTDHFGVDESHPVPTTHASPYPASKAAAERLVMAAHRDEFRTVVLRPHLVWGPGASQWVRGFLHRAERGAGLRIGDGSNRVGMTFLDDCVAAHLTAMQALAADARVGGAAYFVHGGEPVRLWDWVDALCRACELAPPTRRIPASLARGIGSACDLLVRARLTSRALPLSRYLVDELTTEHYSDISRARERLGYIPRISIADGISRVAQWYRATRAGHAPLASTH
jgi:2-alkyl-3-oxoalkanoate reductase